MDDQESMPVEAPPTVQTSRRAWGQLGTAVRSITPASLLRSLLVLGGIAVIAWLVKSTWPALLPFLIGAVVAYAVLPLTNRLDRFMPRSFAVVLSVLVITLIFGAIVYAVATILSRQIYNAYTGLPSQEEIHQYIGQLDSSLDTLPPAVAGVAHDLLTGSADRVRSNIEVASAEKVDIFFNGILTLFNAVGFILGFLVIPAWLLLVLQDQRAGAQAVQRMLPRRLLPDIMALWRIIDRAFRTFLEGQVFLAVFVSVCLYIGLTFFATVGLPLTQTRLAAAVFAGVLQLIPTIGPAIVIGIILLSGFFTGFQLEFFILLGLYVFVLFLVKRVAEPRIEQRLIKIHPALLVMVVVALSEFGLLWILLAAPITAVCYDLFMYVYGRLSDPPRPAGLLPDEPLPQPPAISSRPSGPEAIPLAYRHGRAARRSSS